MRVAKVGIIPLLAGATSGASDFLTEGVDSARTGWVRDECHDGQRRKHEAALEAEAREQAARDAQPVCAARGRARHNSPGPARARGCRRRLRRPVWHRRREWRADLASSLRQHPDEARGNERHFARAARRPCPRWLRPPGTYTTSTRSPGTVACGRSISRTGKTPLRQRSSSQAAASRTLSTCTTASSTPPLHRAAAD